MTDQQFQAIIERLDKLIELLEHNHATIDKEIPRVYLNTSIDDVGDPMVWRGDNWTPPVEGDPEAANKVDIDALMARSIREQIEGGGHPRED